MWYCNICILECIYVIKLEGYLAEKDTIFRSPLEDICWATSQHLIISLYKHRFGNFSRLWLCPSFADTGNGRSRVFRSPCRFSQQFSSSSPDVGIEYSARTHIRHSRPRSKDNPRAVAGVRFHRSVRRGIRWRTTVVGIADGPYVVLDDLEKRREGGSHDEASSPSASCRPVVTWPAGRTHPGRRQIRTWVPARE